MSQIGAPAAIAVVQSWRGRPLLLIARTAGRPSVREAIAATHSKFPSLFACHSSAVCALLPCFLLLMACAGAPDVVTDYDHSHDFSTVRTIAILPLDRTSPAQVVISPAQADRIERVLTAELERRELEVVRDKTVADMFLSWDMVVREGVGNTGADAGAGAPCGRCTTDYPDSEDSRHTAGTLIVDMIDTVQLRSVWRATVRPPSRTSADAGFELKGEVLREAVRAALAKFPPRAGADA